MVELCCGSVVFEGFVEQRCREKERGSVKGSISTELRPLNILQVVILLRTLAAYETVFFFFKG